MLLDTTAHRGFKPGMLALAVTCALATMQAQAVGLGGIEVKSKLNEPFVAEIPLDTDYSGQTDDMVVHLASPEEFERVGLERPHEMSANLTFTVTHNAQGEAIIRVTTPQRMTDPYVSFLLEAEWGNGKMVREYTAMLEPPHTVEVPHGTISAPTVTSTPMPAPTVSAPVVHAVEPESQPAASSPPASPVAAQAPPAPQPEPATSAQQPASETTPPEPVAAAPQPEPTPAAPEPSPPPPVAETPSAPAPAEESAPQPLANSPDSITVSRGQTLSSIAGQVRSPDVSLNRMMIALQRANPDAFIGNNINRLKAGVVLRMPDADQARAVTPDEANALVHEQVESWRQGAQPAPQLQPEQASGNAANQASTGTATSASKNASSAGSGAAASTAVAGAGRTGKPRGAHLEILPPVGNAAGHSQSGSSEGGSGSELRAELAQSKEELTARKAEISDLKAHVADLEKIKTDSQKLLSMKDSQLAALQQRLAELEKKDADAAAAQASPASPASAASPAASAQSEATAAASSSSASEASPAASGASPAASGASPSVASTGVASPAASPAAVAPKKPAPAAHPAPPMPQEPETPWYLQPFVLAGAGLILFAGLLGLMLRRPRTPEPPRRRSFDVNALPAGSPVARATAMPEARESVRDEEVHAVADAPHEVAAPEVAALEVAALEVVPQPVAPAPANPAPVAAKPIEPPPGTGWTAVSRIEAARAYIENGDVDNARSMLEAALIEGNAAQQEEAFKLLDMIESW